VSFASAATGADEAADGWLAAAGTDCATGLGALEVCVDASLTDAGVGSVSTGSVAGATTGLEVFQVLSEFWSSHSDGEANATGAAINAHSAATVATVAVAALRFGFIVIRHFSHPPSQDFADGETLLSKVLKINEFQGRFSIKKTYVPTYQHSSRICSLMHKREATFLDRIWRDTFGLVPPSTRIIRSPARNLWRDIFDGLADAVIAVDGQLNPIAINPAAETMLGVSQLGRTLFANIVRHNDWLSRMLRTCIDTGQNLGDPDAAFNIGPRAVTVRAEISPLAGADGQIGGAIIMLHDLSHQRSAEHAVEGPGQLRLSPAGLAHEVKNPLTGIKGAAELLATLHPEDKRARQYCDVIMEGVDRIASLVEQVLAVSAPRRVRQDEVNIHKVIHQAMRTAGLFPKPPPEIIVEQEFDPSLPEVIGDEPALERVIVNLVRNGLEAMDNRGKLRIRTRMETEFRLAAEGKRRQFLRIEVVDSGRGMTQGELDQLFTPFFTTKPAGTGLGLVLSQRVIALHGGKLWAERGGFEGPETSTNPEARSRGMSFKVTLPVKGQA